MLPRATDRYQGLQWRLHHSDVIMSAIASQITGVSIVYSTVCSKKTSKLRVTGLCEGNSPVTGEFPAQRASNADFFHLMTIMYAGSVAAILFTGKYYIKSRFDLYWLSRKVVILDVDAKLSFLRVRLRRNDIRTLTHTPTSPDPPLLMWNGMSRC